MADNSLIVVLRSGLPALPKIKLWPLPPRTMASVLAIRNLVHDRVRFVVTIVGVVFAVVLINTQLGLFLGFARTTSGIITHSGADLWLMAPGTSNVDQAVPIAERRVTQALAIPGVLRAKSYNVEFARFKKPDGSAESTIIVGFDLTDGLGRPWELAAGDIRDLRRPDTIMIDELYRTKLGVTHIGQVVEINGIRARVVGFTRGVRSFTQSPYVFTSAKNAITYGGMRKDQTKFALIEVADDADVSDVRQQLQDRISDVEVLTTGAFALRTETYWMFTTGAGLALLVAAIMGGIVGVVVVSQTLYATTIDHLPEFATLRAMGAPARFIYRVIVVQAIASGFLGYLVGLAISLVIVTVARRVDPVIVLPWQLVAAMLVVTLLMCSGAAMLSISKVTRLDPTAVFK